MTLAFYATTRIQQGEKNGQKHYNITTTLEGEGDWKVGRRQWAVGKGARPVPCIHFLLKIR